MTGRSDTAPRLTFDRHESGFPVAQELMTMALDAAQVEKHLGGMASEAELKDRMVRQIVSGKIFMLVTVLSLLVQTLALVALKLILVTLTLPLTVQFQYLALILQQTQTLSIL